MFFFSLSLSLSLSLSPLSFHILNQNICLLPHEKCAMLNEFSSPVMSGVIFLYFFFDLFVFFFLSVKFLPVFFSRTNLHFFSSFFLVVFYRCRRNELICSFSFFQFFLLFSSSSAFSPSTSFFVCSPFFFIFVSFFSIQVLRASEPYQLKLSPPSSFNTEVTNFAQEKRHQSPRQKKK